MSHTRESFRLCSLSALALAMPLVALANADVEKNIADSKNWAVQAGDEFNHRYSQLNQINAGNVGKMQVAWTFSTGVLRGHEGSPLVIGDTMYLHSPFPNKVFAIDLNTQKILWKYEPKQDPAVIPQMCCDTVNRGLAYAEGKVFLQQADSTLVALDAKTGNRIPSFGSPFFTDHTTLPLLASSATSVESACCRNTLPSA